MLCKQLCPCHNKSGHLYYNWSTMYSNVAGGGSIITPVIPSSSFILSWTKY